MSEESKCCGCVEEMAEKLEKFKNFAAIVFEGGDAFVSGIIRDVIDGEILHMDNATKQIIGGPGLGLDDIYISICAITEFAPLFEITPATISQVDNIQNQILQNSNATIIF